MNRNLARFSSGVDADGYVPRLALESALAELGEVTDKHPSCAALVGASGLGKTLLLQVLRQRLEGAFECLYLPSPRLAPHEVWRWAAQALGLGRGEDDRGAVLGRAARLPNEGSGLVLLVDDATRLPAETREDLLAAADTRGFTLVLAFDSDDLREIQSLPSFVYPVEIGPAMTLAETRAYVHGRLRTLDPEGSVAGRLTAERLAGFHEAAAGVPARLNALLDAWLADAGWLSGAAEAPAAARMPEPAARENAGPAADDLPSLPPALEAWAARLREPRVQLALGAAFFAAILGSWLFAWRLSPGVSSVGVPVEETRAAVEPIRPERAIEPPAVGARPPVELAPAVDAQEVEATPDDAVAAPAADASTEAAETEAEAIETAPAPRASRPLPTIAPPLPAEPPLRDAALVEAPVEIASAPFPDEHVPAPLQEKPLAAPPPGPRISVNARPWATIALDGRTVGETPIGELRVAPGPHVVTATLADGRVIERQVEAKSGDLYLVFP